jgi:aspartyl-tRNA(Asn)/glutamyl-tRNA(Gln) amidotransferase subunit C
MSKVSREDVKQIAALARLELSEADINKYQAELSSILDYVDLIEKVDTKNIEPTAQVTGLVDVVRKDEKVPSALTRDDIFANTPEVQKGYVKTKSVLE